METVPIARQDTTDHHIVHGVPLNLMRIGWFAVLVILLLLYILALPPRFTSLRELSTTAIDVFATLGMSVRGFAVFQVITEILTVSVFVGMAGLLFVRRSNNWYTALTSIMLMTFGLFTITNTSLLVGIYPPAIESGIDTASAVGYALFVYFLYTIPDGKFLNVLGRIIVGVWVTLMAFILVVPETRFNVYDYASPYRNLMFMFQFMVFGASIVMGWIKMDRLGDVAYQQAKWVIFGLVGSFVGWVMSYLPALFFPELGIFDIPFSELSPTTLLIALTINAMLSLSLMLLPIGIGFSILRYRLWDVDWVLNRGVVYGLLTGLMGLFTLGDLLLFHWMLRLITGRDQTTMALLIAAGISGAVFMPNLRWMQRWVDKNLYGIHVDYKQHRPSHDLLANVLPFPQTAGRKLGQYELGTLIGRGGMAEVYQSRHPTLNQPVAVKVLPGSLSDEADFRARFAREAQMVAAMRHTNIVQLFDFGAEDETLYMVMEYLPGGSLSDHLKEIGPLPVEQIVSITDDIASALDYAHEQGIVHRDIKPSNVLLDTPSQNGAAPRAVLMDFGIARILNANTRLTQTGMMGTLDYIAPEQIRASRDVDGRADIYSLGVMLYQMATGKLPFRGDNPGALILAHLQTPPPDPRLLRPDLPRGLGMVITRAMAKDPDTRYARASKLAADCRDAFEDT